ncbi:MAG: SDR family NAD(P)-dependent oxidoreductase [Candidatus Promineifilaceae bacterium]|nr:SDR family NAD(P)-dependent oxidoreductase [Candidatus Promineifilaceae bacterium]
MQSSSKRAIAIVGVGAILPEAPTAPDFWNNIVNKKYSITEVPPERWSPDHYYDPDPSVPDKTYSKIGGWVRGFEFDWRKFRMPPKVAEAMDQSQQWAVSIASEALADYGYPERPLNTENTAVIIGTAMGGEQHYITNLRISFPEYADSLESVNEFSQLPDEVREGIINQWRERIDETYPPITEDTMPGELANIVSGRVASLLNLRGPNYITDAACASSFAAINDAVELLVDHHVDAVLAGGVDHLMNAAGFVKFCKIGALSATGSRPFGEGADGFVMGEGSAIFLLKRLEDAERNGDKIYAVIRGVGGASDGKGKGITAPNPIGQELAIQRAWENAGLDPATATLVEAHGTSTRVGDVVEVESLTKIFGKAPKGSIGLGSAKSNIGHLKAGAGAAGMLKATMAIHHKILPPTLNAEKQNPYINLDESPFYLVHDPREWTRSNGTPRRCGVSAYGFGGTNFHIVLEEYVPGALQAENRTADAAVLAASALATAATAPAQTNKPAPVRGILALGAASPTELKDKLDETIMRVEGGWAPSKALLPRALDIEAQERLVIDFADHAQLLDRLNKTRKVMGFDNPQAWKAVEAQGIFRGSGAPKGKIAFLFPGQGSQYVNMGRELKELSPVVAKVIEEGDEVMVPILGEPLSDHIYVDPDNSSAVMQAQFGLMQTEITQPAMLTLDIAILKLLAEYGFKPDMVMGHSLGEYAGLIAAGIMPFADALEATAARGSEMSKFDLEDNGKMAAVLAPYEVVMATIKEVDGYVVPANINSYSQCVIGGSSAAVEAACKLFEDKGYRAIMIPVSHAFHTKIIAPASEPLREVLDRLRIYSPQLPLVANLTGEFYPQTPEEIKDCLQSQVASPVQWVKGLETLYDAGVRMFVEVGPKRALRGFARDVFSDKDDVQALMTMHPKTGELESFNQALCGLYAAGYMGQNGTATHIVSEEKAQELKSSTPAVKQEPAPSADNIMPSIAVISQVVAQAVQQAMAQVVPASGAANKAYDRNLPPQGSIIISGTGLGLPGAEKPVMDPNNAMRILRGEQFVDLIPERFRNLMVEKRITKLVKAADGNGSFVTITDPGEVIKLAGRPGYFDLAEEYGVPVKLVEALDITTQLAIAAGLDSLREAGIPLLQTYRRTTTGKYLPERWMLPEALRDETGVIFASAFPGGDRFADEFKRYYEWQNRLQQLEALEDLKRYTTDNNTLTELNRRIVELQTEIEANPYNFDRRFLFRVLSMGHSQFAQYIGARGPNTHVNAACASTAQGVALAEDWIRSGRCRRVLVIGGDAVTSDHLMEWVGSGFLATGAVTTSDRVDEAALPFDRRRHGTIMGMGACSLVVESEDAVRERGMRGIVELLSSETSNSAFHGTRLDLQHISMVMNNLVTAAERRFGLNRYAIAPNLVFMSHETYTPARGGSAAAEVVALRETFGESANDIIIANTKGFTGHPMGVGVEDVIVVKILEHGIVPPVPNFKEIDPDLGPLNLSRGGRYPVQYAIHLAAGFGSQISLTMTRRIPGSLDRIDNQGVYDRWLSDVSGYDHAETEVVKRVLRIKAQGAPPNSVAPSRWQYGTGPVVRALEADGSSGAIPQPAHMVMPDFTPAPQQMKVSSPPSKSAVAEPVPATPVQPKPVDTVAQQPTPAPVVEPAPVPAEAEDTVAARIVALVAKQTGYPEDMLDLDLDMEADLGIDTVKQAETFGAIQEEFDIPARSDLSLRDYNTLEKVVNFVKEMRPDLATTPAAAPAAEPVAAEPIEVEPIEAKPIRPVEDVVTKQVVALVAEQTGYPEDMLELDLDLEADLGIDTVKQAETFLAIRETFNIPQRDDLNLRDYDTLEKVIGFVKDMRPDLVTAPAPAAPVDTTPSVPQAPETAAAEAPAPAVQEGEDVIAKKVIALVAEQTGYPEDMLELDLDLEADLGIDTVKQAETFLAIRETFDIPQQDDLNLRDYDTLEKVIGFVKQMRPDLVTAPTLAAGPVTVEPVGAKPGSTEPSRIVEPVPAVAEPVEVKVQPAEDVITAKVLALVSEQTGYPEDMLELDLDLEADLGIDTVKQAETFLAIRETFNIPQRDDLNLRDYETLEKVIGFVKEMRPDLVAEPVEAEPVQAEIVDADVDAQPAADEVTATVLGLVSEQTGYPIDMLELDLDLEADLGIDTVKQAETFLAIRETFNIPQQEDLSLRDYDTLEKVIGFVREMRPDLAAAPKSEVELVEAEPRPSDKAEPVKALPQTVYKLEDADNMPRRVPVPSLRPSLDLCKTTGVTLGEASRIVIMPDQAGVHKALTKRLEKLGAMVMKLDPSLDADELIHQLGAWDAEHEIQGVYWLSALDVEPSLDEMDLASWRMHNEQRVKKLYRTMRALYETINKPGTFLMAATRMGGLFGYGAEGASAPLGGAVTGFVKAYHIEQRLRTEEQGPLVKAIDFEVDRKTAVPADRLIAETLFDPGVIEIGYYQDQRYTVTLEEQAAGQGQAGMELGPDTLFVVTGAAGGITSEIVTDLAAASQGIFYLLDLVEAPNADDPVIQLFRQDKEALKRQFIEEARAAGERPTPVEIEKRMMATERNEAALRAVESVEAAGGTAQYRAVNLLDSAAITAIVDEIREEYGRIDVLIHAGGLLIDRTLPNKEPEQFDLVYDVKADGFFNILHAAKELPLGATVCFSSVAGRFGNNGQSDYSAANDLLCKITNNMRQLRPGTKAIAIDWTAWGEIGMAARGSVPTVMKAMGIDMLPPESGVPTVRRELVAGDFTGEILVGGALGFMTAELDETGGLDVAKANEWLKAEHPDLLMVGEIKAAKVYGGLEVETTLVPEIQPFLFDHAPDENTPWLPGVMATEALAEIALLFAPGYQIAAVENEQMMGAFKFFRNEPRTLYLSATCKPEINGELKVRATLRSVTQPAREGLPTRIQEHFIVDVHLSQSEPEGAEEPLTVPEDAAAATQAEQIYEQFFHGPAYQVLEWIKVDGDAAIALVSQGLPPNTDPADARSLVAPRLVEACFQAAAQWSIEAKNAMAFPLGFDQVIPLGQEDEVGGQRLYTLLETADDGQTFDAKVVGENGRVFVILRGYRTVSRPGVAA